LNRKSEQNNPTSVKGQITRNERHHLFTSKVNGMKGLLIKKREKKCRRLGYLEDGGG
jgi:hypothetical protein